MGTFKVSVLITFYNQEKYVDKALKSVLEQKTNFDFNVLVGDDGSSDDTCKIVMQWMEKYPGRIELYVMDRTTEKCISGFRASKNRLNLLKHVQSEYFIFLDGDDYYDNDNKLQRQAEILDNPENADCVACGHNADMLFQDGLREPTVSSKLPEGKYSAKEYWKKLYFHTDTLLIRSSVILSIPMKLLENNFNDNLITYVVIQKGKVYYIPEVMTVYLQTDDGIWTGGNEIINHIRNMFLYDLCNQINPNMKKETSFRFAATWMELYRNRKKIDSTKLQIFSEEAKNKNMVYSYKWIHYNEMTLIEKQLLCIVALFKAYIEMFIFSRV